MSQNTTTTTKRYLADMEPQELRRWLLERQKRLVSHRRFVQQYLHHRQLHRHCKQTYADRQYSQFQALADDLVELLEEVICNIEQHLQDATEEDQQA
jgi:hypothetical protein